MDHVPPLTLAKNDAQGGARFTHQRVLVLGATGTAGRATVQALLQNGHEVHCLVRGEAAHALPELQGAALHFGDVTQQDALQRVMTQSRFDVLLSCLASRSGDAADAWAIDHDAHAAALATAKAAGVRHMVLMSAICVQKPRLQFQFAKLKFESALVDSGLAYSIVRPTALFKSLSGQVARVKQGKPFMVFGDGRLTRCKPISDGDLAAYMVRCVEDPALHNRILPIGGPGPALTPRQQGEMLFALLGKPARFTHVPPLLMDTIIAVLSAAGVFSSALRGKAEFARIGRYYATESMLVLNAATGRYDAEATPSTGNYTLQDHYARLIADEADAGLGAHAVFKQSRRKTSPQDHAAGACTVPSRN